MKAPLLLLLLLPLLSPFALPAQPKPEFTQQEIIYGRKDGMALTMVVLTPTTKANGKGVISLNSLGWKSTPDWIPSFTTEAEPLLSQGFTVFIVLHGSQPKYNIKEIATDVRRAVRHIRFHARQYKIDPNHIGIIGRSAGGHLALVMGIKEETPDPAAKDPVDQVSGRVQAVVAFYPPTDMNNWTKPGESLVKNKPGLAEVGARGAFEFVRWDQETKMYQPITELEQDLEITRQLSPFYFVSADDPPTLLIHGDADDRIPFQQSEKLFQKLQEAKVPSRLLVKKGGKHWWPDVAVEIKVAADWFTQYLK